MTMRTIAWLLLLISSIGHADQKKIGLVLDRGGKDDKSFNAAAYRGLMEAKKNLGIYAKEVEASDESLFEPAMRSFAEKKFDLIIAIGVAQAETVRQLSKAMPGQKFAIIDAVVDAPNVTSLVFNEHEGSYLVGYIAAMKSKTGSVGFVGGMKIPLIERFELAYRQGAKAENPKIKVLTSYVGFTSDAWNNPSKANEIAQNEYSQNADVLFVAAGASNNGVFDAAVADKKYAIGVDSNQNWIKPGTILTSMVKHVDTAVYNAIQDLLNNKLASGVKTYGIKNGGVDWAYDEYNKALFTPQELARINQVKAQLVAGKIAVQDFYKIQKTR